MTPDGSQRRNHGWLTLAISLCLMGLFYAVSWSAVRTKSPTVDEPLHAASAWTLSRYRDYRANPEDPPLWQYWAALPHPHDALRMNWKDPDWIAIPKDVNHHWWWSIRLLFRTEGNDGVAFINRSRAIMLVLGVALCGLICWWGWKLGGAVASIVAGLFFALDPNFLAHAPLVKNDVVFSLAMTALACAAWWVGRAVTWPRVAAMALLCGVGLTVKFSGLILLPLLVLLLMARALLPHPWSFFGRLRHTCLARLRGAAVLLIITFLVGWGSIWAVYRFRFRPTPDHKTYLDIQSMIDISTKGEAWADTPDHVPTRTEIEHRQTSSFTRFAAWLESRHLLPQTYIAGLLYTHGTTQIRPTFLMGNYSILGWWYYFPLVMLFKTPLATLAALCLATVVILITLRTGRLKSPTARWTAICLALPLLLYGALAMRSHINLGLRHILPIYPFLFLLIGLCASRAHAAWPRLTGILLALLAIGLTLETAHIHPNHLSFFNAAAGGPRGGAHLAGDCNIDWGQDLPALARWQHQHPGTTLYLAYFGTTDPNFYGIRFTNIFGGYAYPKSKQIPDAPGILAISVTDLQGIYQKPEDRIYRRLLDQQPVEIVGSSIYLYQWTPDGAGPLHPSDFPPPPTTLPRP